MLRILSSIDHVWLHISQIQRGTSFKLHLFSLNALPLCIQKVTEVARV